MSLFEELEIGQVIAEDTIHLTRDNLVRYAGASLDFNPIHYRDDVALAVGLPGVLAHGMLTMGVSATIIENWLDGAGWISDYQVRFTKPVVVHPEKGADLAVRATVSALNEQTREASVTVEAIFEDKKVLGRAKAELRFHD